MVKGIEWMLFLSRNFKSYYLKAGLWATFQFKIFLRNSKKKTSLKKTINLQ